MPDGSAYSVPGVVEEIVIVGGGPAGAYLAYCLARKGIYATIFDHSHPREKPCGGGLTPFALQRFPLLRGVPASYRLVHKMRFISPEGKEAVVGVGTVMNVSRERLDSYLLDRAVESGATLVAEQVTGVEANAGGWVVKTSDREYAAGLIVGADGVTSVVRRDIIGGIPKENMAACTGYIARGAERDHSVMRFLNGVKGYAWIFPRETHSSIGVGLDATRAGSLNSCLDEFVEEYCPGIEKVHRFGAVIPSIRDTGFYKIPCAGRNWIVIGDAAGHVDPILGEGIRYALWSAELAAEAIGEGDPAGFDRLWREAYYPDFIEACRLRDFVYDPFTLELGVTMASSSPTFAQIVTDLVASEQTYRGLRSRVLASLPRILAEARSR